MQPREFFGIDDAVRMAFPEIIIAATVIHNVKVAAEHPELEALKPEVIVEARERLGSRPLAEVPRVQAFRRIYKKFGVDPGSRRPSAEALLRRVVDPKKGLYKVNTVVDTYNLTSIQHQLPMAAYDLDHIRLPIVLRFAQAGELFRGIGQAEPELLAAGELVYADQQAILCRDFNYRDADATKVTAKTRNIAVFMDGCAEVQRSELAEAMAAAARRLIAVNGGTPEDIWLFPAE